MENNEIDYEKVFKAMLNANEQLDKNIENFQDIPYEEQTDIYMKYIQSHNIKTLGGNDGTKK